MGRAGFPTEKIEKVRGPLFVCPLFLNVPRSVIIDVRKITAIEDFSGSLVVYTTNGHAFTIHKGNTSERLIERWIDYACSGV